MFGPDKFAQLGQKAFPADENVQWIERFHRVDLLRRKITLAKRRHTQVHQIREKGRCAKTAGFITSLPCCCLARGRLEFFVRYHRGLFQHFASGSARASSWAESEYQLLPRCAASRSRLRLPVQRLLVVKAVLDGTFALRVRRFFPAGASRFGPGIR